MSLAYSRLWQNSNEWAWVYILDVHLTVSRQLFWYNFCPSSIFSPSLINNCHNFKGHRCLSNYQQPTMMFSSIICRNLYPLKVSCLFLISRTCLVDYVLCPMLKICWRSDKNFEKLKFLSELEGFGRFRKFKGAWGAGYIWNMWQNTGLWLVRILNPTK